MLDVQDGFWGSEDQKVLSYCVVACGVGTNTVDFVFTMIVFVKVP